LGIKVSVKMVDEDLSDTYCYTVSRVVEPRRPEDMSQHCDYAHDVIGCVGTTKTR
jgi:hypothetical protein